jgi:hypothetical protein
MQKGVVKKLTTRDIQSEIQLRLHAVSIRQCVFVEWDKACEHPCPCMEDK